MIYKLRDSGANLNVPQVPPGILRILSQRGVRTNKDAMCFLNPSHHQLHDPFLFKDMGNAVELIKAAVNSGRHIVVHGDYDVDGTMATSCLYLALRKTTNNVSFFIPDRHKDGYGLKKHNIDKFPCGCLLITVDCGITAFDEVEYAKSKGIDCIITDHHNAPSATPNCVIIDAKVPGETYPFKELCGAGVAAKLIQALLGFDVMKKYIDLVALATVSDVVPLVGENRVIVAAGLSFINRIKRPGIAALVAQQPVECVTSSDIGFKYGPMLNACGRLGDANDVVRLMCCSSREDSDVLAAKMNEYNRRRKDIETNIFNQCISMIDKNGVVDTSVRSIVLWDKNWEAGVIGIVASRIAERYHCPVCLLCFNEELGLWCGSGRSIDGINLYEALSKCESIYSFGGHDAAAGMKVEEKNLELFKKEFDDSCRTFADPEEVILCDLSLKMKDIDIKAYYALRSIQPCGEGNPEVKVLLSNVSMKNVMIRAGKHFSASVFDETGICDAICFNADIPSTFDNLDIVASIDVRKYKGKEKVQLQIISFMKNGKCLKKQAASSVTQYGVRVVDQPIEILGLTKAKLDQFKKANIETIQQLINYLPTKYMDFRRPKRAIDISIPEVCSMIGTVYRKKYGDVLSYAMCHDDDGGTFMVCWFRQDYNLKMVAEGGRYIFCGTASRTENGLVRMQPTYFGSNISKYQTIIPQYRKIPGMSSEFLINSIDKAIQLTANTDFLDRWIVDEFQMMSDYDATKKLHHPLNDFEIRDGQERKSFNDLFRFNFILKSKNKENQKSEYVLVKDDKLAELKELLPYKLTGDQNRCIDNICEYVASGKILNALVQGDVGSGKTMVALFSILLAINNGYQACLIAPTEVLARQHFEEISGYLGKLGYNVGYLVGGMKVRERKSVLKGLEDGSINAVIGTHAIIQDTVLFNNLAVCVIDEQHKFGVKQREKLSEIHGPHTISMSATPIPRTLSMALYGDNIQVYSIKEKPAGRKEVMTMKMYDDNEINQFMLKEIRAGRQCYVVCPMIDEMETGKMAGVSSVQAEVSNMMEWFKPYPEVVISNTTGRMKKELIAEEISKFVNNESNILISTTIIEVGVNVPNATVMVLKSSERFGLAQAHQLRGRVGRGSYQSYCLLQTDKDDEKADILCESTDGFEIAKQDMLLRGAGDYIGTQQTGDNSNVMLMMANPKLFADINDLNDKIYQNPALFAKYEYILKEHLG